MLHGIFVGLLVVLLAHFLQIGVNMKSILEFSLPEDAEELQLALSASKYNTVLWELDQYLRNKLKYEELTPQADAAFQDCRDKLHELTESYGVKI